MEQDDFKSLQYQTIRKEIEDTRDRIFKMAAFGIVIVPGAQAIAEYQQNVLLYFIPFAIVGIVFVHMAEKASLMRCGLFIKENIESESEELREQGWEHWLEKNPPKRDVDKYITIGFYILFLVYYMLSVALIWSDLYGIGMPVVANDKQAVANVLSVSNVLAEVGVSINAVMVFYAILGVGILIYICFQFKHLTSTSVLNEQIDELRHELCRVKEERDKLHRRLGRRGGTV